MDRSEHMRVVQFGSCKELIAAIREDVDVYLNFTILDSKIEARKHTKPNFRSGKKPKFYFGKKFFVKLSLMPAVSIEVKESRSHIRKTCYGFRDKYTGERVYLRIDPGSVVEFRDSPAGFILGTRYLIPQLDKMRGGKRWDKVNRKLTCLLSQRGIIVTEAMAVKHKRSARRRASLARKLVALRIATLPMIIRKRKHDEKRRPRRAKTKQQVS